MPHKETRDRPIEAKGPSPLRDAYQMLGTDNLEKRWKLVAMKNGLRLGPDPQERLLFAYVNEARWVADCPNCNGGIAASPRSPIGACLDCGYIYAIAFPDEKTISDVEDILGERPAKNRNWYPQRESVEFLAIENEAHMGRSRT